MNRKLYTLETVRDAVEIRTMLAYPYGTSAWIFNADVHHDIAAAYSDVWLYFHHLNHQCNSQLDSSNKSINKIRSKSSSLRAFNVLLKLARREITEDDAKLMIRKIVIGLDSVS
jgi:hypothetical protein